MPAAIPAIAGAAASYGVTTAIVGTALEATFAGALLSAVGGLAASTAVGALIGQSKGADVGSLIGQPGASRTQQFRQPTPPREVVLGRVKKSGPWMFAHTAEDDLGRADGYFYIQHALAGHHCKKIAEVYLGDELASDEKFDGLVQIGRNLGADDQMEDANFLADLGEELFGDHWLRGVCNIATRMRGDAVAFPNGLPNIAAIVWGAVEILDPRTGTTSWTNNAALCYAWWKTWDRGMKVEWDDIDEDTLIDSANVCDERVRVRSGSATFSVDTATDLLTLSAGARALDVGDGVRLTTTGALPAGLAIDTTYYAIPTDGGLKLATTVANAMAETAIDITGAGTGTQTIVYWDEARYKLNGSFTLDQDKFTIRDMLLAAMSGFDVEVGGKWFIHAAAPITPTQTLTAHDLRGAIAVNDKRSIRDQFNAVRARFVNPDNFWQPSDAPPLAPTAALFAEDNGTPLWEPVDFSCVTSGRQVQRLMKLHRSRNRQQRTVSLQAMYTAMPLRPLAGVYLTFEDRGLDQSQHVVMNWTLTPDLGVDLVCQSDSPSDHDWDPEADEQIPGIPQDVTLPDPSSIAAPAAVTVETPETPTYTHLKGLWSEVKTIWLDGYDVEYRDAGGTDWTGYGRVGKDVERTVSVERTTPQDFRVRAVTRTGAPSGFTTNLAPADPTNPSATGGGSQIVLDVDVGVDAAEIQIFEHESDAFGSSTLLDTITPAELPYAHGGLGLSETHYYWFRAVNADGNISAASAGVSAVTDA